jgi:Na+-driven multidrug efflux pump
MIPYGLALGIVTLVGSSLGSNDPIESKRNFVIASSFSAVLAGFICITLIIVREILVQYYTDNIEIQNLTSTAFFAFGIAYFFDWNQC